MPPQPSGGCDPRITRWAGQAGKIGSATEFAARLDGSQVGAELLEIFRETPEFGRSLAARLDPFLDEGAQGSLLLIGGGGEAIVFGDEQRQYATKLLAPPGKAAFGWIPCSTAQGRWTIRAGTLAEALLRFSWFEDLFPTGLDLDQIGEGGGFLVLRQPFILGSHPDAPMLSAWMAQQGWARLEPPTDHAMLRNLTWHRDGFIATDVRPENALVAECDGELRAIDFVIGRTQDIDAGLPPAP